MSVSEPIDLDAAAEADAARREARYPDGIPVIHKGVTYLLPAELPADALDPLLGLDVDLAGIVGSAVRLQAEANEEDQRRVGAEVMWQALAANPRLPVDFWTGVKASLALLFGEEAWARFTADRPSLPTYVRLVRMLSKAYGVGLGEAFASAAPSDTGGETSNPTSKPSTESTRGKSGRPRAVKAS
jgi:hypothetical protein